MIIKKPSIKKRVLEAYMTHFDLIIKSKACFSSFDVDALSPEQILLLIAGLWDLLKCIASILSEYVVFM